MNYHKTFRITAGSENTTYGVVYGNEKIVFIEEGADENIKGYQDKYVKMSQRIHARMGATVICALNPDISSSKKIAIFNVIF